MTAPDPIRTASYIIYQTGSNIYSINGITRTVDYSNTNNDAYPVIQGSINNLWSTTGPTKGYGGLIHIKAGQYNLSSGLIIPGDWNQPHYVIEGEGQDQTILKNLSKKDAITVYTEQSIIKNLTINGSTRSGNGLRCDSDWSLNYGGGHGGLNIFYNLGIHNNHNGVYYKYEPNHNILLDCMITNNRNHGIYLQGGIYNNENYNPNLETIAQCYISGNGGNGISIDSGNTNTITNCEITSNKGWGIYIGDAQYVITNPAISSNGLGAIYGTDWCVRTVIFGQNIQGTVNFALGCCTVGPGENNCIGYNKWYKV